MNAVLLAAGLGTRLRPLTDHTPKCLVSISGRPLLDYWLCDLNAAGFDRFLVNTHHLPEQVERFIASHLLRDRIELVHEDVLLGTAGTLLKNREFLSSGSTLVAHADNLCLCRWEEFVQSHRARPPETIMTMMTFETTTPEQCGIVELDRSGIVCGFHEKIPNPPGRLANAAVYLMEPEMIETTLASFSVLPQDLSTEVLPRFLGRINTWQNRDTLIDIGIPERLAAAHFKVSAK